MMMAASLGLGQLKTGQHDDPAQIEDIRTVCVGVEVEVKVRLWSVCECDAETRPFKRLCHRRAS